jgi:peptidoglycan/LPS O-acetylase OafA/YrhL
MSPFLGGIVAAFLVRNEKIRRFCAKPWVTPLAMLSLYLALTWSRTIFEPMPFLFITFFFVCVACGNSLFGVLTFRLCRLLGQVSYSIYLLHCLTLFVLFYFVFGFDAAAHLSYLGYWTTVSVGTIFLVILCGFTYTYIEKPGIDHAESITRRVNRLFRKEALPGGVLKTD